jgi:hypothetical protein
VKKEFIVRNIVILLSTALLVTTSGICRADNASDPAKENAELRQRVERLEKELEELKKIVLQQAKTPAAETPKAEPPKTQPSPAATPNLGEADLQKIAEMVQKETTLKKPVWSGLDIQIYGYIKADASYDTSRTTPGNYVLYVDSEKNNKNDNEFNLTVNQTRFGVKITGSDDDSVKTSGLVEGDFYGSYAEENKAKIQLRHAYLKLDWPQDKFSILAGQTSDTMSPLLPDTLNYTVLWDAGNIGYRRPQIRLTKGLPVGKDTELQLEGAIARTIGRSSTLSSTVTSESGEDAGYPTFQGRASVTLPWVGFKPMTVGFSGHLGREEYDTTLSGTNKKFESWSINLDLTGPINKWLTIKGELFTGENLNTYFGGIGQGVNIDAGTGVYNEIAAKGGWVGANLGPWGKWRFNVGAGVDSVDKDDINVDYRTLNRSIFGNVIYSINKNAEVGFELSSWQTDYKGLGDADSLRAQTSLIYKF